MPATILPRGVLTVAAGACSLESLVEPNWTDRSYLLTLMAAVADRERAASLPDDDELVAIARRHRLSPLLSATAQDSLPARLAETFRRDRMNTVVRNMLFSRAAEECIRALAADGIPSIVLKGLAYEQSIYPGPGTRPTSDVDLLIPNEERRRAFGVLDRMGFEPKAAAPGFDDVDYHEVAWTRAGVEIDLHLALAPFARCDIDYRAVWAAAVPLRLGATDARALRADHAAVFHALHMAIDHFGDAGDLPGGPGPPAADGRRHRRRGRARACLAMLASVRDRNRADGLTSTGLAHGSRRATGPSPSRFSRGSSRATERLARLPRPEQLLRKLQHFDTPRTRSGIWWFSLGATCVSSSNAACDAAPPAAAVAHRPR